MPTTSVVQSTVPVVLTEPTPDINFDLLTPLSPVASMTVVVDTNVLQIGWPLAGISSDVPIYLTTKAPELRSAPWPPPWFSSIRSARTDTSERTEDILRAEFGRNGNR